MGWLEPSDEEVRWIRVKAARESALQLVDPDAIGLRAGVARSAGPFASPCRTVSVGVLFRDGRALRDRGIDVLVGDPGRRYLPTDELVELASYGNRRDFASTYTRSSTAVCGRM
jgi:hypothetical protein